MTKQDQQLDTDHLVLDVRHMADWLADVVLGARQGLRSEHEGFPVVVDEVCINQPNYGERAGISPQDFEAFTQALERRDELRKYLYKATKITEKLEESYAVTVDQLQRMVFGFANIIDARAKAFDDEEILALYERVRAYRSAIGLKAAKTRRRNEAGLEQPENEELPGEVTQDLPLDAVDDAR